MRVELFGPVKSISGSNRNSDLVFYPDEGGVVARWKGKARREMSDDQVRVMEDSRAAAAVWSTLPQEVLEAWQDWAERWDTVSQRSGRGKRPRGQTSYVSAASKRLMLDLPAPLEAPIPQPPAFLNDVRLLPMEGSDAQNDFRFELSLPPGFPRLPGAGVGPDGEPLPDYFVFARLTAAMPRRSRGPRKNDYRSIRGYSAQSALPLPANPESPLVFSGARFAVPAGARFGIELRLIRSADGVSGPPVVRDVLRS